MKRKNLAQRGINNAAIRTRIRLIAQERNLPKEDTAFAFTGRLQTFDLCSFAERHGVSLDWLICGDLKGLLRTVRAKQQTVQRLANPEGS
jgi:hypothetical protein